MKTYKPIDKALITEKESLSKNNPKKIKIPIFSGPGGI